LPSVHAQPEPVPSGERTVVVIVTVELESYANSPFEFASAALNGALDGVDRD
jgi:hypothetical protein